MRFTFAALSVGTAKYWMVLLALPLSKSSAHLTWMRCANTPILTGVQPLARAPAGAAGAAASTALSARAAIRFSASSTISTMPSTAATIGQPLRFNRSSLNIYPLSQALFVRTSPEGKCTLERHERQLWASGRTGLFHCRLTLTDVREADDYCMLMN